ncbi:hypothetical protein GCM10009625_39670 [Brachybacterium fresconis]
MGERSHDLLGLVVSDSALFQSGFEERRRVDRGEAARGVLEDEGQRGNGSGVGPAPQGRAVVEQRHGRLRGAEPLPATAPDRTGRRQVVTVGARAARPAMAARPARAEDVHGVRTRRYPQSVQSGGVEAGRTHALLQDRHKIRRGGGGDVPGLNASDRPFPQPRSELPWLEIEIIDVGSMDDAGDVHGPS